MSKTSNSSLSPGAPSLAALVTAFAALYLCWGSTYLAIKYAVETIPPFLMAGARFVTAGSLLYAWACWRGGAKPTRIEWRNATLIGALLLVGGNGLVSWAEQRVPSGIASLMLAVTPLWIVMFEWLAGDGLRPTLGVVVGLFTGFVGMSLLVVPGKIAGGVHVESFGAIALIVATLSWAGGSVFARRAKLPKSHLMTTAMEMLAGGSLQIGLGLLLGEGRQIEWANISARSLWSLGYLTVFGSLVGFSAYVWLITVTTPARAATYAYVNPVIAVFLGWAVAKEEVTPRTLLASAIIIAAVIVILRYSAQRHVPQSEGPEPSPISNEDGAS